MKQQIAQFADRAYGLNFLSAEEQEYREFCLYVDDQGVIMEGLIGRIAGKLKAKLTFIKDLATKLGADLPSLIKLFKQSKVFKFFHRIGWSFAKLYKLLRKGMKLANNLADVIAKYIADTKVAKWTAKELAKLDEFLKTHPKTKRIVGVAVAAILAYIWFNMTFTGDWQYDFGMGTLVDALAGNITLATVFGGKDGVKLLMLFATGLAGLGFPWPGPNVIKFAGAVIHTIMKSGKYNLPTLRRAVAKVRR